MHLPVRGVLFSCQAQPQGANGQRHNKDCVRVRVRVCMCVSPVSNAWNTEHVCVEGTPRYDFAFLYPTLNPFSNAAD